MGRPNRKIKGYSSEDIKSLFHSDDRHRVGVRLYAVYQISLGRTSLELADVYNTSFKQILNWVDRFEKEGLKGLMDKPGRGRKSRMSDAQKERLKTLLVEESPLDYGYDTKNWNGPILTDWLADNLGVVYRRTQIYNVLKSLGFSYQRSRGFYLKSQLSI